MLLDLYLFPIAQMVYAARRLDKPLLIEWGSHSAAYELAVY